MGQKQFCRSRNLWMNLQTKEAIPNRNIQLVNEQANGKLCWIHLCLNQLSEDLASLSNFSNYLLSYQKHCLRKQDAGTEETTELPVFDEVYHTNKSQVNQGKLDSIGH